MAAIYEINKFFYGNVRYVVETDHDVFEIQTVFDIVRYGSALWHWQQSSLWGMASCRLGKNAHAVRTIARFAPTQNVPWFVESRSLI